MREMTRASIRNSWGWHKHKVASAIAATLVAASFTWATASPSDAAGPGNKVTVNPRAVLPTNQYYQQSHKVQGTGAFVTLRIGPNKTLRPWFPIRVQECAPNPTSSIDCDQSTTLTYDPVTRKPVRAAANGSVTVHFLLWSPLPNTWDPSSVIDVGPGHPAAIWVGDDPSNWVSGFVTRPIQILSRGTSHAPRRQVVAAAVASSGGSPAASNWTIVAIGLVCLAGAAGGAIAFGRVRAKGARL
jgi:hypothetical protein